MNDIKHLIKEEQLNAYLNNLIKYKEEIQQEIEKTKEKIKVLRKEDSNVKSKIRK